MISKTRLRLSGVQALNPTTRQPIHRPVSFELADGGLVVLIGANGAGKSSLLDRIVYPTRPMIGAIEVDRSQICFLPQIVEASFHLPLCLSEIRSWVQCDLTAAQIADKRVWQLASGGERQLVLLEFTLGQCRGGGLLVLDEPTNHLDKRAQTEFEAHVLRWKNERIDRAVVVVSHKTDLFAAERTETIEVAAV